MRVRSYACHKSVRNNTNKSNGNATINAEENLSFSNSPGAGLTVANNFNISSEKISKKLRLLVSLMKGVHKALYDASTKPGGDVNEIKEETIIMIKSYMQEEDIYKTQ